MIHLKRSEMTDKDIARFWEKVDKSGDCWLWMASTISGNLGYRYGQYHFDNHTVLAHRFAYAIANGDCPNDYVVDHLCHNTLCVNPAHLQIVTQLQNSENRRAGKNSKTGIRGVCWDKRTNKWMVSVRHNWKQYFGGRFSDINEAKKAAISLRNKLMTNNLEDRNDTPMGCITT